MTGTADDGSNRSYPSLQYAWRTACEKAQPLAASSSSKAVSVFQPRLFLTEARSTYTRYSTTLSFQVEDRGIV